ncbi:MAG TPA: hypothetical protein VMB05_14510 [Solirubrobacteraceae bacterium]|nr:hypothetical protein [Solirubrobacteraceae bacterium]
MGELLEAVGHLALVMALFGVLAWALYFAFGPQVIGLPAMLGALVIVAGVSIVGNVGIQGVVFVLLGLAALIAVIGMAMNVADRRPSGGREPRTVEESQPVQEPIESSRRPPDSMT